MADYWIKARYAGKCTECECDIVAGERVLYSPNENGPARVYCAVCGDDLMAEEIEIEIEVD